MLSDVSCLIMRHFDTSHSDTSHSDTYHFDTYHFGTGRGAWAIRLEGHGDGRFVTNFFYFQTTRNNLQ